MGSPNAASLYLCNIPSSSSSFPSLHLMLARRAPLLRPETPGPPASGEGPGSLLWVLHSPVEPPHMSTPSAVLLTAA